MTGSSSIPELRPSLTSTTCNSSGGSQPQNLRFEKKYWADDRFPIFQGPSSTVRVCFRKDRSRWAAKTVRKSKIEHWSQLVNEIEMVQQVQDHPNINPMVDVFEDDRCVHIVSDLCTGGRLSSYVQSTILDNPNPEYPHIESEAACIIQQLLRAVDHCHDNGIVHRDLKLDNVLFRKHKSLEVRLIDFDISCKHAPQDSPMTEAVGTKAYMAPEVFQRSYNNKCDVWSIGVVAHTLLSGELPFSGKDDEELIYKIQHEPLAWDAPCWKYISGEAKEFIRRCLEKDPSKRPSAEELLSNDWMGVACTSLKRRSANKGIFHAQTQFLSKWFHILEEKYFTIRVSRKLVIPEQSLDCTSRTVRLQ